MNHLQTASLPELIHEIGSRSKACIMVIELPARVGPGTEIILHKSPKTSLPTAYGMSHLQANAWSKVFEEWLPPPG